MPPPPPLGGAVPLQSSLQTAANYRDFFIGRQYLSLWDSALANPSIQKIIKKYLIDFVKLNVKLEYTSLHWRIQPSVLGEANLAK